MDVSLTKTAAWLALALYVAGQAIAATAQKRYFAHAAAEDRYGVIAPWYKGQNGQFDFRVRVAAETMKRYPWAGKDRAVLPAPEYVYDGKWNIDSEGKITVLPTNDWADGDLGQRAAHILGGMIDYYRYSGDPAAFAIIRATANYLVDHCETSADHGWPNMLISVPTMGVRYGDCRLGPSDDLKAGNGKIQLDIVGEVGFQLVRAYEMMGDVRWYNSAKHWADLLAANRRREPGASPWGRYADNADGKGMNGVQTGGVADILEFFDELIRTGYTGPQNSIIAARNAGRLYLRDVLLPAWTANDTWGRNYWDWEDPVHSVFPTFSDVSYLMDNQNFFPNWRNDVRNILGLYLNHTSVSAHSQGDTYSGAWAYPESSGCCGRSLSYSPMTLAATFARYGVEASSEWGKEIARRSQLIATYDALPDGQAMDDINGGNPVDGSWFKIAQPMALVYVLETMGWLPDIMGANREDHIMRSSSVVRQVTYGKGAIEYTTFDAPAPTLDVLRLAFVPASVTADGRKLAWRSDLAANGYTVERLVGGDAIVTIRHDGATEIGVEGPDPQTMIDDQQMTFEGDWRIAPDPQDYGGSSHVASQAGASASYTFVGNRVQLVGSVRETGGRAEVVIDGIKQLVPIDGYSPTPMHRQILYYTNGLSNARHTLKVVVEGEHNPLSTGDEVFVDGVQYSDARGDSGFGEGGGPTDTQRMIFGYTGRTDYIDWQGNAWRPGTEFTVRTGDLTDSMAKAWWTVPQAVFIHGASDQDPGSEVEGSAHHIDPNLYRYGVHWPEFTVNVTVGPGTYHVRLKFAETQYNAPNQRGISIYINGEKVADGFDVFATAGGANRAVDLVYNNIQPVNGVVAIRFVGSTIGGCQREAMVQALEVGPGDGGTEAPPKSITVSEAATRMPNEASLKLVTFAAPELGGMKVSVNVILPRDYATSNRRFPVLYLLDGYGGDHMAWVTKSHIIQDAARYGEIIVMPDYGVSSWYVNSHANPSQRWEDYMVQDLIPYVDSHYRTIAARRGRGTAGDSMGGYGAMMLGLKHPDMFATVASLSGTLRCAEWDPAKIDPGFQESLRAAFGPQDNPARAAEDPFELVKKIPRAQMPQLYISIGEGDGHVLLEDNRAFARLLAQLKIPYEYREVVGGHQWPVWEREIRSVLDFQAPVLGVEITSDLCAKP